MSNETTTESVEKSRIEPLTDLLQSIPGDQVLLWSLLGIAGYMFVTAGQFSTSARLFPRLAAGVMLLAGALQLVVRYLDLDIERSESVVLGGGHTEEGNDELPANLDRVLVLGFLIAGYIIAGFFVGLLWVTPVFVFVYLAYTGQPKWKTTLLTALMTGIAYGFMTIMNLDLMTGGF